jgi:hypothetical protein
MEKFNSFFDILGHGTNETQLKLNLFINYPKLNRALKTVLSIDFKRVLSATIMPIFFGIKCQLFKICIKESTDVKRKHITIDKSTHTKLKSYCASHEKIIGKTTSKLINDFLNEQEFSSGCKDIKKVDSNV